MIFEGLKFHVIWTCYRLEIFMDINFCGCFVSCVLLYLPKYVASYGNYVIFFGYHRPPYIQGSMGTRFYSMKWKAAIRSTLFCSLHNEWWQNFGPCTVSCMCTVLVAAWVNSVWSYKPSSDLPQCGLEVPCDLIFDGGFNFRGL